MAEFGSFGDSGYVVPPLECIGEFTSTGPVISQSPAEQRRLMDLAMQPTDPGVRQAAVNNLRAQRYREVTAWLMDQ